MSTDKKISQGLTGLWIFASTVWIIQLFWNFWHLAQNIDADSDAPAFILMFVLWGMGPPVAILCIGLLIGRVATRG
jgi:hypothetical protein